MIKQSITHPGNKSKLILLLFTFGKYKISTCVYDYSIKNNENNQHTSRLALSMAMLATMAVMQLPPRESLRADVKAQFR